MYCLLDKVDVLIHCLLGYQRIALSCPLVNKNIYCLKDCQMHPSSFTLYIPFLQYRLLKIHFNSFNYIILYFFFCSARVELELRGVNLTRRLETALTLRNYLQKQVHKLVEGGTTTEIARTVSGIWPEQVCVL